MEVTLNLEVSHTEPEHRQFVQATSDLFWERQQSGEMVQLHVQAVPVPFGWIGLHCRRLHTLKSHTRGANVLIALFTLPGMWWTSWCEVDFSCPVTSSCSWCLCFNTGDWDVILTHRLFLFNVSQTWCWLLPKILWATSSKISTSRFWEPAETEQ